jgi:hypothetical protein
MVFRVPPEDREGGCGVGIELPGDPGTGPPEGGGLPVLVGAVGRVGLWQVGLTAQGRG